MPPTDDLLRMLAPAGGGIYVVSTGVAAQRALQREIYGATTDDEVGARFRDALQNVGEARVAVIGVPSDCGAGFVRGANKGPEALRRALLQNPQSAYHRNDVVDLGDVRVVPHFLSEEMLSDSQRHAARVALYGDGVEDLPVSPLGILHEVLVRVHRIAPAVRVCVLGGDHSVGWPAFAAAHARAEAADARIGLLHFDAHTDLLEHRLGVRYCFATWAYHANELLQRDGRLVQVGIRASARNRAHWESTFGVRQYWPEELALKTVDEVATELIDRYRELGVTQLYISNDIDGTDEAFAGATGTPEPNGLNPDSVNGLVARVAAAFPLVSCDLVEVAPPLSCNIAGEPERTLSTAAGYLEQMLQMMLTAG